MRGAVNLAHRPETDARRFESLRLTADFQHHGERPTFHPAWVAPGEDDKRMATPLNWRGSADLCTLAAANALICFPAGERTHAAGELVRGMPI